MFAVLPNFAHVKKYKWHKIADHEAEIRFEENGMTEIGVSGKKICLLKSKDTIRACAAKCPHASGVLAEGFIDTSGNVVCPVHRYRFDPSNGRNVSGEGYYLKTYPVEIRDDGIYLGLEESGLFGWL